MKKTLRKWAALGVALTLALSLLTLAGCGSSAGTDTDNAAAGKQTASAWLSQDDTSSWVTIDLTGGWSVEFARGAAYLYDVENVDGQECVAMLITLDKEVYDEYVADANASDSFQEVDGGIAYTNDSDESAYLFTVGSDGYFLLTVNPGTDGDAVYARISAESDWMSEDSESEA